MHKASVILLLLVCCSAVLPGCGQKGPLYLPQSPQPTPEASKPAAAATGVQDAGSRNQK